MLRYFLSTFLSVLTLSRPVSAPANVQEGAPPQAMMEWRAQLTQIGGNTAYCLPNARVIVRVKDGTLVLHIAANQRVTMMIPLDEDGGAGGETSLQLATVGFGGRCRAKISMPAGNGPRIFEIATYVHGCRYRIVPA